MWLRDTDEGILDSPDFRRIQALPVCHVSEGRGRELSEELSPLLRKPGSRATLKWPQAWGLDSLYQSYHQRGEGAYFGLPPGAGKTLLLFLAPVVLGISHSVLIAPASLHRDKTALDFQRYSEDWHLPHRPPDLINLEALSLEKNLYLLEMIFEPTPGPKLVLFDECDLGRNWESAAVKRLDRFRADHPEAVFVCATGSGMRFDCKDYAHHINWCLPHGGSPFPYDQSELERWARATAPKERGWGAKGKRPQPGVLLNLIEAPASGVPESRAELAARVLGERVNCTPGVTIINDDDCDQPMTINLLLAPEDPAIDSAFTTFRREWTLPNGYEIVDSLGFWQGERTLGCGFFRYPDPPPPEEWSLARRLYHRRVLRVIQATADSDDPADTPFAVERAFPDDPIVAAWKAIKPTYDPEKHRKTEWISDSVVDFAVAWGREHRSLIWTGSVELGERIAMRTGWRYYGAEGKAGDGSVIVHAPAGEPAVVSIRASGRGQNLQHFSRGLILMGPQSADERHQLYKRLHRFGQESPVIWDELITSGGADYSFDAAVDEARGVEKQRKQQQIILRADIRRSTLPSEGLRWARKPAP